MTTKHSIIFSSSQNMTTIPDNSVQLIVTSPPYPMVQMWDDLFAAQNPEIADVLKVTPHYAYELMHRELDKVWSECIRVLAYGGIICVNIGDTIRTFNKQFQLFDSHSRIAKCLTELGVTQLPCIIWTKPTNSPNGFLGSGMYPVNSYAKLEHEYILIFRKGACRKFSQEQTKVRRNSAFFFEERNRWFSDSWHINGVHQSLTASRNRSAAYPLQIPYRLLAMHSIKGDSVLDPFGGLQTTTKAAMLLGRNSIGYELDNGLEAAIMANLENVKDFNYIADDRIQRHREWIGENETKYFNPYLQSYVHTFYETELTFEHVNSINEVAGKADGINYQVEYDQIKQ